MKRFALTSLLCVSGLLLAMEEQCCLPNRHCEYCAIRSASTGFIFCLAAAQTEVANIRILLEEGIDPNSCVINGMNPFFFAVCAATHMRQKAYEAMRLLATHGADVNAARCSDGSFPLLEAVCARNTRLIRELVKLGADVDQRRDGRTALWSLPSVSYKRPSMGRSRAIRMSSPIAVALIECGASIESPDLCELNFVEYLLASLEKSNEKEGSGDDEPLVLSSSGSDSDISDISDVWVTEDDAIGCRISCQMIEDALNRRQAVNTLVGCDVARCLRTGRRLLPRELICSIASFLGIELPLLPRRLARRVCGVID